jgi:PAS domain S-box-containing protein
VSAETPLVVHGGADPPAWTPSEATAQVLNGTVAREALAAWGVALIDAATTDAIAEARRLRAAEAALHIIIVAPAAQRAALERALLFAPGVGEVWIADASQLDAGLLGRAAEITRARRSYRATRTQLAAAFSGMGREIQRNSYISDAYLAALLRVLPDPILSLDEDGCIASFSPATESVFGLPAARITGHSLADVVRPVDERALQRLLRAGADGAVSEELLWRRGDEERAAHVAVAPVDAAGQAVRAVLFRDTTEQHLARSRLEEQATELEEQADEMARQRDELARQRDELARLAAERMGLLDDLRTAAASRGRFYASMSHEIRTPINAILGYNDLLLAGVYGVLEPDQRAGIERAQGAARHLRELVNDVLDLSKIESGRIEIVTEPVVLRELVDEVIATMTPVATAHDVQIRHDDDDDVTVATDPRRVRQVLLNLLSNAVKFGAGATVRVRTGLLGADFVRVAVQDAGRGIAPDQIDRIFDEFVQLEEGDSEGTGLGLAISRRLAIAMGGTLSVASATSVGSTFTLTLPLAPPAPPNDD